MLFIGSGLYLMSKNGLKFNRSAVVRLDWVIF